MTAGRRSPRISTAVVFTAFGDQGVSYHALANDQLILGQDPSFPLHAGDICYADPDGEGADDDTYDARAWDQFLAQTESVAKSVPWMVTTGNHDMEAWYSPHGYGGQNARWTLPGNGPDAENVPGVHSFTYGNVAVVALDANDVSYEIPDNQGCTGGRQTRWLDRRLAELRSTDGIDFLVVSFPHCAFSTTTSHASEGGVRDAWLPLFDKHQVDLVINGHNHVYERTDAIKGGRVTKKMPVGESVDTAHEDIVYVTAGGAGRALYDFPVPDGHEGHVKDVDHVDTYYWPKGQVKSKDFRRERASGPRTAGSASSSDTASRPAWSARNRFPRAACQCPVEPPLSRRSRARWRAAAAFRRSASLVVRTE